MPHPGGYSNIRTVWVCAARKTPFPIFWLSYMSTPRGLHNLVSPGVCMRIRILTYIQCTLIWCIKSHYACLRPGSFSSSFQGVLSCLFVHHVFYIEASFYLLWHTLAQDSFAFENLLAPTPWSIRIKVSTMYSVYTPKSPFYILRGHHMSQSTTKPTKLPVRPAKTQISLGIYPVWSESPLPAWRRIRSLAAH